MWRSHNDVYGHYDVWHRTYPTNDTDHHHHDISPIRTIPPLSKKDEIRDTPCVSLHQKSRSCCHSLFLCDRPYSPFSGFYDQDDVYVGSEYDVFGGESALSSSLTSTTSFDEDIFSDDPFSIPHLDDKAFINRSSSCGHQSSSMPTKRIRTNDHGTRIFGDNDHIMKRRKTDNKHDETMDSDHHIELTDYPSFIFSSSNPIPVDGMLEYN